jgi:hypothetical protein
MPDLHSLRKRVLELRQEIATVLPNTLEQSRRACARAARLQARAARSCRRAQELRAEIDERLGLGPTRRRT